MAQIKLMADRSAHRVVFERVRRDHPDGGRGLRLMDAPCGAGAMSRQLQEHGFEVSCYDIDPGNFEGGQYGLSVEVADLNRPLAIPDAGFDVIVSIAGIQRLFCPENAIFEFARLLKPGGTLYLSCPNFATLDRRLSFLFDGSLGMRFDRPGYEQTVDNPEANVRMPITLSRVKEIVAGAGLDVHAVEASIDSRKPLWLLPVTLLVMGAGALKSALNPKRYRRYADGNGFTMLSSKNFLLVCRKR